MLDHPFSEEIFSSFLLIYLISTQKSNEDISAGSEFFQKQLCVLRQGTI